MQSQTPGTTGRVVDRLEILSTLGFGVGVAWLLWRTLTRMAAAWGFVTDDAYITLRYAQHLLAGEGLVWNVGEAPVEGYSNFLYVLIAAGFGALDAVDVVPLELLGGAGLLATGYLQWAIARRFVRALPALLPFAIYTLQRGALWWSVSGLETGAYAAIACAVVLAGLRGLGYARVELGAQEPIGVNRGPLAPRWFGLAGGLCVVASLLRPEGPLLALAVVVGAVVQRGRDGPGAAAAYGRAAASFALVFGPAMVLLFAWRGAYFGELLPNTVRCKTGHADRYALLRDYWEAASLAVVVALIHPLRRLDARVTLPLAVALAYALALIGADPLVAHDLRHFLAAHALICVLAGVGAVRIAGLISAGLGRWHAADPRCVELLLVAGLLLSAGPLGGLPAREELRERATSYQARAQLRARLGRYLASELRPGERVVLGDVGVVGYVAPVLILDAFCLNEPALAEPPLRDSSEAAAAWIVDQGPALIVVHTRSKTGIKARGAVYRALVEDPRFVAGWREQRRFNGASGSFHYVVFRRVEPG